MNRWYEALRKASSKRQAKARPKNRLGLEALEDRCMLSAAQHILLLSVDGFQNANLGDPSLQSVLKNVANLEKNGVTYNNAFTTSPSDSFPGTLSYLTGAGPGATGVFYDDSYSRTLRAPGSNSAAPIGTEVNLAENIDKNQNLLSGGGNFDASSIDPTQLPIDPITNQVVYPNQFLKTNTIFDVAHQAGLYTAFSDKHPAYQIATGDNAASINDLYTPEINSFTALYDPSTGKTINADSLRNDFNAPVQGLTVSPGYTTSLFANGPTGATQPDSVTVDGLNVYVGYNNGAAKDGSSGFSTIAQFAPTGPKGTWAVVSTVNVDGHTDGLKVDPTTHKVWALQNEDANPNLVVIDYSGSTPTTVKYILTSVNGGGGFDDIAFVGGKTFLTASNPANNPNADPAVVQITLGGSPGSPTAIIAPVLFGDATATNTVTGKQVTLNLQDPDSMTVDPHGNLVFTSQADNELVTIHNPGTGLQTVSVTPLSDAGQNPVSVDDTLFNPGSVGQIVMADQTTGLLYQVTVPAGSGPHAYSAAADIGELGTTNLKTGLFTPVITGLGSPRGLAFLNAGPFADLSKYTLVDASTDPLGPTDPNLQDTTTNFLLAEKYDDLKVQAILNEIKGLPSHAFFNSDKSKIPAIFGMNFQAVSVAQKDARGGINLLPNGQEGSPSAVLEAAMQHTDASIGKIVAALKAAGIWSSTELFVTAKHGQDPRVGLGGLIKNDALTNVVSNAGVSIAQATQDDVALLWLSNQKQTAKAVSALEQFKATGQLNVVFQGAPVTLAANQVIDKILSGQALVDSGLGNPAKDSTTPDIIITLKPGYILVGNTANQHKRAEHGGFNEDDTHIALVVSGGAVAKNLDGSTVTQHVDTKQIAVSALDALGLDPTKLTGAVAEGTQALPGLGLSGFDRGGKVKSSKAVEGKQLKNVLIGTFTDSTAISPKAESAQINWGDGSPLSSKGVRIIETAPHKFEVLADHVFTDAGTFNGFPLVNGIKMDTFQWHVSDAQITAASKTVDAVAGQSFSNHAVATFSDGSPYGKAGDYSAVIHWGDGKSSKGMIQSLGGGKFEVLGGHDYATAGTFKILVDIQDEDGAGVKAHSTAKVRK